MPAAFVVSGRVLTALSDQRNIRHAHGRAARFVEIIDREGEAIAGRRDGHDCFGVAVDGFGPRDVEDDAVALAAAGQRSGSYLGACIGAAVEARGIDFQIGADFTRNDTAAVQEPSSDTELSVEAPLILHFTFHGLLSAAVRTPPFPANEPPNFLRNSSSAAWALPAATAKAARDKIDSVFMGSLRRTPYERNVTVLRKPDAPGLVPAGTPIGARRSIMGQRGFADDSF